MPKHRILEAFRRYEKEAARILSLRAVACVTKLGTSRSRSECIHSLSSRLC
jgi:hypothetical protein